MAETKKVKLEKLINSVGALNTLSQMDLGGRLSYWVAKINYKIDGELKAYNKGLTALKAKMEKPVKDVKKVAGAPEKKQIPAEDQARFLEEVEKLQAEEIDMPLGKIKLSMFLDEDLRRQKEREAGMETKSIPAYVYTALFWILDDDEEAWMKEQETKIKEAKDRDNKKD